MTHEHAIASTVLLGAFGLSLALVVLFVQQHDITGYDILDSTNTTVFIINSTPVACGFNLSTGFNLVSGSCFTARPVIEVLNNTPVLAVYEYTPFEPDKWKVYNPYLPGYVINDLEFMTRRSGYVIIANGSASVVMTGSRVLSTDIALQRGWNLVGYPTNVTRNVTAVMAPLLGAITNVTGYDTPDEQYVSYPGGGLENLTPGQGYWVNMTVGGVWTVSG